jgi:hypothetical protein
MAMGAGPAARSYRPKAEILARFKEGNARSAPFFLVCVGMALALAHCKQHTTFPFEKLRAAKLEVGGPAQHLRAGAGERKRVGGGMISDSRSLLSAGKC